MAKGEVKKPVKKNTSVALVGTASTMKAAPFDDKNIDIWACSPALPSPDCTRVDVTFEMHPYRYYGMPNVTERLLNFDGPVYMQDHYELIPNSIPYPYDEVKKEFYLQSMGQNIYVTNTITWMILLAIYQGYEDISLFGVHMAHDTEYIYQQPSCSWALGLAQGRGISIWLPKESSLLKARYEYGYGEPTKFMSHAEDRTTGLRKGVQELAGQLNSVASQKMKTEGALSEAEYWLAYLSGYK